MVLNNEKNDQWNIIASSSPNVTDQNENRLFSPQFYSSREYYQLAGALGWLRLPVLEAVEQGCILVLSLDLHP